MDIVTIQKEVNAVLDAYDKMEIIRDNAKSQLSKLAEEATKSKLAIVINPEQALKNIDDKYRQRTDFNADRDYDEDDDSSYEESYSYDDDEDY